MSCFNCNFNIVDCFKLFEEETRYVLCPRRNAKKLEMELGDLIAVRVDVENEVPVQERQPGMVRKNQVVAWIQNVVALQNDVEIVVDSLGSSNSCIRCCCCGSNYSLGKSAADLLERIRQLKDQHKEWEGVLVVQRRIGTAAKKLEMEMKDLRDIGRDTERRILVLERTPRMKRTNQVASWIERVGSLGNEVDELLQGNEQEGLDVLPGVGTGSAIADKLARIHSLKNRIKEIGDNLAIEEPADDDSVPCQEELPVSGDERRSSSSENEDRDHAVSRLRVSYDSLDDDLIRSCFLYCFLQPKDENIPVHDLAEYWVGEGLLDGEHQESIHETRRRGLLVLARLKSEGLLEAGSKGDWYVRMNEAARYMASRITRSRPGYAPETEFLVYGEETGIQMYSFRRWDVATRVSLLYYDIEALPDQVPTCPNLLTLLMKCNPNLCRIRDDFFRSMPVLRVLDLSFTSLTRLPSSIGSLAELRYLNLNDTPIEELPRELGKLRRLRQLSLNCTLKLERIPRRAISELSALQSLNLHGCAYWWGNSDSEQLKHRTGLEKSKLRLPDLEQLTQLEDLGVDVACRPQLNSLIGSSICSSATRRLTLEKDLAAADISVAITRLQELQLLYILGCNQLEEFTFTGSNLTKLEELLLQDLPISTIAWKDDKGLDVARPVRGVHLQRLRHLDIERCHSLEDVAWVGHLPSLEQLGLRECSGIQGILGGGGVDGDECEGDEKSCTFPKLVKLELEELPRLASISGHRLLFPLLHELHVIACPKLKRLPLSPRSAKRIEVIYGDNHMWWESLEWDSGSDVEAAFARYFQCR